jgi:hypothetical protein
MADNIDEEHLDSPTNTQPDNPSADIITTTETETITQNQETENMEVHHHPDLHHEPKKWKEYFLEFLMIFLAVTMGFFAESYREHLADKEKVKHAIGSLVKCLASDTVQLNTKIRSNLLVANYLDSVVTLKNANLTTDENKQKFYDYSFTGFLEDWYFKTNDVAMQQIKSNGILGLIKNQNIIDSIFGYELKNQATVSQQADNYYLFKESLRDFQKVVDFTLFRDSSTLTYKLADEFFSFHFKKVSKLTIDTDKEKLKNIFSNASVMAAASEGYAQFMQDQKDYAKNLIIFLNKEYHLEKK